MKTQDQVLKTNRNEPENEAEKLLKTRSCGKSEAKTNRKTNLAMLLKIKTAKKRTGGNPAILEAHPRPPLKIRRGAQSPARLAGRS
ncbi:MAG TPA: hypothetical protein VGW37_17735 [Terriglobia bacterium]|nr:hypothetical protein [Terriglobia bacterium]